jgi:hypothetical protein
MPRGVLANVSAHAITLNPPPPKKKTVIVVDVVIDVVIFSFYNIILPTKYSTKQTMAISQPMSLKSLN